MIFFFLQVVAGGGGGGVAGMFGLGGGGAAVRFLKSFEPCYYIKRASTGFLEFHFRSSTWRLWGNFLFSAKITNFCFLTPCVRILLYMYVSSYRYICVLTLLYMCPHTAIHGSSYCYTCV
jgi:hypothetical protein